MYIYMHVYMHAYINTYINTYIHTQIHAYICICVSLYIYIIYIPHIYQYYRCEQEGFRSILFFDLRPTASTLPNTTICVPHTSIRVPNVLPLQVLAGGLEELERPEGDARDLPPDRTMLGRSFWTYIHR